MRKYEILALLIQHVWEIFVKSLMESGDHWVLFNPVIRTAVQRRQTGTQVELQSVPKVTLIRALFNGQLLYLFECTWFVLVMKLNSVFAHPFFLTIKCNNGERERLFWHIYFPFSLKSECHKRSLTRDTSDYEFRACACISLALMPLTKVRDHPQSTDLSIMRAQYSSPPISQNRRLSVSGRHLTDVNLNLWPKSEISENDSLPEDNIAHQIFWQIRSNNRSWKKFSICLCFCGCVHTRRLAQLLIWRICFGLKTFCDPTLSSVAEVQIFLALYCFIFTGLALFFNVALPRASSCNQRKD